MRLFCDEISVTTVVDTAASVQERDGVKLLFKSLTGSCKKIRRIWVNGGYRGANNEGMDQPTLNTTFCAWMIRKGLNYCLVIGLLKELSLGIIAIVF